MKLVALDVRAGADRRDRHERGPRGARRSSRHDRRGSPGPDAALRPAAARPARARGRRDEVPRRPGGRSRRRDARRGRGGRAPRAGRRRGAPGGPHHRRGPGTGCAARPGSVAPAERSSRGFERPPRAPLRAGATSMRPNARRTSWSRARTPSRWSPSSPSSRTGSWPRRTATGSWSGARSSTRTGSSGSSPISCGCRCRRCGSSLPTRAAGSAASSTPSTSRSLRSWRFGSGGRSASS